MELACSDQRPLAGGLKDRNLGITNGLSAVEVLPVGDEEIDSWRGNFDILRSGDRRSRTRT